METLLEKTTSAATIYRDLLSTLGKFSIQMDGVLGATEEIEFNLVGIDLDDSTTGMDGSGNQPVLDCNGNEAKMTSTSANPTVFDGPVRMQIKKPSTANAVGFMLLKETPEAR